MPLTRLRVSAGVAVAFAGVGTDQWTAPEIGSSAVIWSTVATNTRGPFEASVSGEYEDGPDGISRNGTARVSWREEDGWGVSADYSISQDPETTGETLRLSVERAFFDRKVTTSCGSTIRREEHENAQNNLDVNLDWTITEHHSLSARYSLTEEREHEGDLTWIIRY